MPGLSSVPCSLGSNPISGRSKVFRADGVSRPFLTLTWASAPMAFSDVARLMQAVRNALRFMAAAAALLFIAALISQRKEI